MTKKRVKASGSAAKATGRKKVARAGARGKALASATVEKVSPPVPAASVAQPAAATPAPEIPIGRRLTERRRRLIAAHVDTKPRRYWKLRFPMR